MGIFYTREETDTEVIITYRHFVEVGTVVGVLFVGSFVLAIVSQWTWVFYPGMGISALIATMHMLAMVPAQKEEARAMKTSGVYVVGSVAPFSKIPRTVRIPKENLSSGTVYNEGDKLG